MQETVNWTLEMDLLLKRAVDFTIRSLLTYLKND
jgi:hypothetical protein